MGSRRVHLLRGRVMALASDTLYLAVTDSVASLAIPRSLIQRLELSRGVPSRGLNALRQGVVSGVAGALTGLVTFGLIGEKSGSDGAEAAIVYGGVSFAAGAIAGAVFRRERWRRLQPGG